MSSAEVPADFKLFDDSDNDDENANAKEIAERRLTKGEYINAKREKKRMEKLAFKELQRRTGIYNNQVEAVNDDDEYLFDEEPDDSWTDEDRGRGRWCECSCDVHLCSLHSAHAHLTVYTQLCTRQA
jgi:hypothetical protein